MTLDGKIIDGDKNLPVNMICMLPCIKPNPICGVIHTFNFLHHNCRMRQPIKVFIICGGAGTAEVPCAEYATFGTPQLAENATKAIGKSRAVLLANHGLLACGVSLAKAFGLASNLEFVAEIQWRTMCAGQPVVLDNEEMDVVMEAFKAYGQPKAKKGSY